MSTPSDHPLGPSPWSPAQGERYRIACRLVDRWWAAEGELRADHDRETNPLVRDTSSVPE